MGFLGRCWLGQKIVFFCATGAHATNTLVASKKTENGDPGPKGTYSYLVGAIVAPAGTALTKWSFWGGPSWVQNGSTFFCATGARATNTCVLFQKIGDGDRGPNGTWGANVE